MAVTIIKPYATTFGKRNKLEHHRNPSGTINKAKWFLSKSERDIIKLNSLMCSISTGLPSSFEQKSWHTAFYMATYCILNKIEKIEDHFNQKNYKNYQSRKSTSSKNIPWYDCLLKTLYENKKANNEQLAKRICELQSDLSREKSKNEELIEELKNEKQLNAEIKKRLIEVEYDCEEFNHEYCDINCKGKRKELVDLYQLISDGLNETLLKQKDEENKQLAKRICELQADLSRTKGQIEKMRSCLNCVNKTAQPYKEPCNSCHNRSEWRLAE